MPVSRKGRVQVDSGIRQPEFQTYRAQQVVHVGPQRKQSEASNFERLAQDLSAFNSSLGRFASGVDAMAKRAEARAKKLEAEKKAAEARQKREAAAAARKKRGSGGGRRKGRISYKEKRAQAFEEKYTLENKSGTADAALGSGVDEDGKTVLDPGSAKETLGDENATKETYKELNEVKAGIGARFDQENAKTLHMQKQTGFMVPEEDEHGEPEQVPTGEFTTQEGPDGQPMQVAVTKPKMRRLTQPELEMEAYKQQKQIDKDYADKPLVRRHLKFRNAKHLEQRIHWLQKAALMENKTVGEDTVAATVGETVKELQEAGLNPDQVVQAAQAKAINDLMLLHPNATREQVTTHMLRGLEADMDAGGIEEARRVVNFLQGSPDREKGVTGLIAHPRWAKKATELVKKASKVIVRNQVDTIKAAEVKRYLASLKKGEIPVGFQNVERNLNGNVAKVSVKELEAATAGELDASILQPDGVPYPPEESSKLIPQLWQAYGGNTLESPALKQMLGGLSIKNGTLISPQDPGWDTAVGAAMTAMAMGDGERAALGRHLGKGQMAFYQQLWALRRNGITDKEQQIKLMNTWLEHKKDGSRPTLGATIENQLKGWKPDGLTREERDQVLDTVRLAVYDLGLDAEEIKTRADAEAADYRNNNPMYNGRTIPLDPRWTHGSQAFEAIVDQDVADLKKEYNFLADKDITVQRYGNQYLYIDKATNQPIEIMNKMGQWKKQGFTLESLDANFKKRVAAAKADDETAAFRKARTDARREKMGYGGFLGMFISDEYVNDNYERVMIEKQEAEMKEVEKIIDENGIRNAKARSYSGPDLSNWKAQN